MSMSQERYYLYLDESGDFWEDNSSKYKSPSLVGGVLCQQEDLTDDNCARKVHNDVVKSFIIDYPQYKDENFDHASELKMLPKDKPEIKLRMVEAIAKAGYVPVVFQQTKKHFIQSNTTTYIIFLVEGIIKLIEDRKIENLSVVVGGRLNLDLKAKWMKENPYVSEKLYKGPHIEKKTIESEFNKFMAVAKIREAYAFSGKEPKVVFKLADDKENRHLILSDYVCNTYFTGGSFRSVEHKNRLKNLKRRSRSERINNNSYQVYRIAETQEAEKLKRYIADRNYGEALFFCMTIENANEELDREIDDLTLHLSKMKYNEKKYILDVLYVKVGRMIEVERNLQEAIKLIDNIFLYFNEKLDWNPDEFVLKNMFFVNLYLYKMAVLTHMGNVKRFKNVADKCEHFVKEVKDVNFYLMYKNRWIVNLQDIFQYKESLECGEELISIMQSYAKAERDIKRRFGCEFNACYDQLPKIANSLALTSYFTLNKTHKYLNQARRYSDVAIKYFEGKEGEIARAYQLRAQIEAEVGNFTDAIQYLNRGLHINFENLTDGQIDNLGKFGWYHVTKILERLICSNDVDCTKKGKKVLRDCFKGFEVYAKNFLDNKGTHSYHPGYANLSMMGFAMVKSGESNIRDEGLYYLQQAYETIKETSSIPFKIHSVIILFKMLSVCSADTNKNIIQELKDEIIKNVNELNGFSEFSSSTPIMKELQELCTKPIDKEVAEKGARLVLM